MTSLWITNFEEQPEVAHSVVLASIINYTALATIFFKKKDKNGVEIIKELSGKLIELAQHIDKNYNISNESSHPAL